MGNGTVRLGPNIVSNDTDKTFAASFTAYKFQTLVCLELALMSNIIKTNPICITSQ